MSSELEIEFKNLVTKEEFMNMIHEFNIKKEDMFVQQNYYFDTPGFDLKNTRCALRIRKKNEKYELTLKQPVKDGNWETNEHLEEQAALKMIEFGQIPDGEIKNTLARLNIHSDCFSCFGCLTTKRAEIDYLDGLLVFDNSSYLNKEDYEIEYEVTDKKQGEENFRKLMEHFQIPLRTTENKIIRFYREYKNLKK